MKKFWSDFAVSFGFCLCCLSTGMLIAYFLSYTLHDELHKFERQYDSYGREFPIVMTTSVDTMPYDTMPYVADVRTETLQQKHSREKQAIMDESLHQPARLMPCLDFTPDELVLLGCYDAVAAQAYIGQGCTSGVNNGWHSWYKRPSKECGCRLCGKYLSDILADEKSAYMRLAIATDAMNTVHPATPSRELELLIQKYLCDAEFVRTHRRANPQDEEDRKAAAKVKELERRAR